MTCEILGSLSCPDSSSKRGSCIHYSSSFVILVLSLSYRERERNRNFWQLAFFFGVLSFHLEINQMGNNPQEAIKKLKALMDQGQKTNSVFLQFQFWKLQLLLTIWSVLPFCFENCSWSGNEEILSGSPAFFFFFISFCVTACFLTASSKSLKCCWFC